MGDLRLAGGLAGARVALRAVEPGDAPVLHHIISAPELRRWREAAQPDAGWPLTDASPETRFTVLVGLRIAGMIRYWENDEPRNRHAGLDIFLAPDLHGRGLGRDAVRTLARYLFDDRGHHRIVVDTATTNEIAIRCYAAVGFRPVGAMRDGLVMDLLPTELR